jgi:hypothetical protein
MIPLFLRVVEAGASPRTPLGSGASVSSYVVDT